MKLGRIVALIIFTLGAMLLGINSYRMANSGEIVGTYSVYTEQVHSLTDFFSMEVRSQGLLIGDDAQRKFIGTGMISFPVDSEELEIRLVIKKGINFRKGNDLFAPTFILMDDTGKEVFRKEVHGLLVPSSGFGGTHSKSNYFIGVFRPENSKKYRLVMSLKQWDYSAMNVSVSIEALRNVKPYYYRLIIGNLSLLLFGVFLLYLTKPKRMVAA